VRISSSHVQRRCPLPPTRTRCGRGARQRQSPTATAVCKSPAHRGGNERQRHRKFRMLNVSTAEEISFALPADDQGICRQPAHLQAPVTLRRQGSPRREVTRLHTKQLLPRRRHPSPSRRRSSERCARIAVYGHRNVIATTHRLWASRRCRSKSLSRPSGWCLKARNRQSLSLPFLTPAQPAATSAARTPRGSVCRNAPPRARSSSSQTDSTRRVTRWWTSCCALRQTRPPAHTPAGCTTTCRAAIICC